MIQVSKYVYRGGEPKDFSVYEKNGIKSVINLQTGWFEALTAKSDREFIYCYKTKTKFFDFSLSQFKPPRREVVEMCMEIILNSMFPVYVHCRHGHERTGFIIAVYRMQLCDWPFDLAFSEMKESGCHWLWCWMWKKELQTYAKT